MSRTACTELQCLYKGDLYLYLTVELYLYSPLWAVRPVQSLSACTRVTFTFFWFLSSSRSSRRSLAIRASSVGIATCYGLGDPGIESRRRARSVVHPASYTNDTASLSRGVKQPGRGVNHLPPPSTKFKERVELYL